MNQFKVLDTHNYFLTVSLPDFMKFFFLTSTRIYVECNYANDCNIYEMYYISMLYTNGFCLITYLDIVFLNFSNTSVVSVRF